MAHIRDLQPDSRWSDLLPHANEPIQSRGLAHDSIAIDGAHGFDHGFEQLKGPLPLIARRVSNHAKNASSKALTLRFNTRNRPSKNSRVSRSRNRATPLRPPTMDPCRRTAVTSAPGGPPTRAP